MNGPAYLERFSICTLVAIHGLPTNDATTKNLVTTGECAVDFIYKNQYRWTYVSDYSVSLSNSDNLVKTLPGGQDNVNIGSGAIGTDMMA